MSDSNTDTQFDELTLLKQRATRLNIPFSNNIGIDALKKKIEEQIEPNNNKVTAPVMSESARLRKEAHDDGMKLIRCRVQNLDPKKSSLPGEVLTVANEYLGTVRKFIPYTADANANGYHIPQCILNMMKERQFVHVTQKRVDGKVIIEARDVPEFNISILPPLTTEELAKLAEAQIAAGTATVGR